MSAWGTTSHQRAAGVIPLPAVRHAGTEFRIRSRNERQTLRILRGPKPLFALERLSDDPASELVDRFAIPHRRLQHCFLKRRNARRDVIESLRWLLQLIRGFRARTFRYHKEAPSSSAVAGPRLRKPGSSSPMILRGALKEFLQGANRLTSAGTTGGIGKKRFGRCSTV